MLIGDRNMLLNLNTGDGKTLPVEIAECGGASQEAGNPPAKMRNSMHSGFNAGGFRLISTARWEAMLE